MSRHITDITGQRYGRLMVQGLASERVGNSETTWVCLCDCGNTTTVSKGRLSSGKTISCGCYRTEVKSKLMTEMKTTHGMSNTPEFNVWRGMKKRCLNENDPSFKDYGGRGVTVCDRWINSFENFIADMGPRPTRAHTVERNSVDGNYEPGNCRWATMEEQQNNKRNVVLHEFQGKHLSVAQVERQVGINRGVLRYYVNKGMSIGEAVAHCDK